VLNHRVIIRKRGEIVCSDGVSQKEVLGKGLTDKKEDDVG